MLINENESIDKFGINVKKGTYIYSRGKTIINPHIHKKWSFDNSLNIMASSKISAEHNSLDGITSNNIHLYPQAIYKATNVNVELSTILNSPLYWLDIKADKNNTTGLSGKDVISILREKSYIKTSKIEIIVGFDKNKGFETSLTLKSTCKTVKDSLAIYLKIPEIKANRHKDNVYFNNFSTDFLEENAELIRFERRLQSARAIKKAFHLKNLKIVTLNDIFNSNCNVVSEKVKEIFL